MKVVFMADSVAFEAREQSLDGPLALSYWPFATYLQHDALPRLGYSVFTRDSSRTKR
jgi:hypothetical protein